jgi:DNA-binding SARP family transcriptional activator
MRTELRRAVSAGAELHTPVTSGGSSQNSDVRISLFGGFQLECQGSVVALAHSAQRVAALLALHQRPLLRPYVAGMLWPETTDERAGANLRSALWRLKQVDCGVVAVAGHRLALGGGVLVDVRDFSSEARHIIVNGSHPESANLAAVMFPAGELLPDWYEDWVMVERERLRQLRLHALELLCELLASAGRYAQAVEAGLAAVSIEPLRESAHRALIAAYRAEGNPGEAIRQYRTYRELLWSGLGLAPSPVMEALVSDLEH